GSIAGPRSHALDTSSNDQFDSSLYFPRRSSRVASSQRKAPVYRHPETSDESETSEDEASDAFESDGSDSENEANPVRNFRVKASASTKSKFEVALKSKKRKHKQSDPEISNESEDGYQSSG